MRQALDGRNGSFQQLVKSECLEFSDRFLAIAKHFTVIQIGSVNQESCRTESGRKLDDRGSESVRRVVDNNFWPVSGVVRLHL